LDLAEELEFLSSKTKHRHTDCDTTKRKFIVKNAFKVSKVDE